MSVVRVKLLLDENVSPAVAEQLARVDARARDVHPGIVLFEDGALHRPLDHFERVRRD